MRNLILVSALLLASAYAGPSAAMDLAAADTPAATTTDTSQPLPPAPQTDSTKGSTKPQTADVPKPRASRPRSQARRYEDDEAKARRIAAKYGISW